MKDSQRWWHGSQSDGKYIKANNERFSTEREAKLLTFKYIKANNERFSTWNPLYRAKA